MTHKQKNSVSQLIKEATWYTGKQRISPFYLSPLEYARDFVKAGANIDQVKKELVACNYKREEISKVVKSFAWLTETEIKDDE